MIAVLLLVTTALYAGFQWTIRVLVYPQFVAVHDDAFVAYEARHQRLVSFVVAPLFVADALASITAFAVGPRLPAAVAVVGFVAVVGLTSFGAVPQHRRLSSGFDVAAHRRLLAVDTARLVAAVVAVAAAVWFAGGRL